MEEQMAKLLAMSLPAINLKGEMPAQSIILEHLVAYTIDICFYVNQNISAELLMQFVASIFHGKNEDINDEVRYQSLFQFTFEACYYLKRGRWMYQEQFYTDEQREAERHHPISPTQGYIEWRKKFLPEFDLFKTAGEFFVEFYIPLQKDIRAVVDAAFADFMEGALNDPLFALLCKDKSVDPRSLSREEKLRITLDHEALYAYFQVKMPLK